MNFQSLDQGDHYTAQWETGGSAEATLLSALLQWWAGRQDLQTSEDAPSLLAVQQPPHISVPCLAVEVWRRAGSCTRVIQANHTCCLSQSLSPLLTKGSLVPILLAANHSVYIFPWSLRKPAGPADCSTSLFHMGNDALWQADGTKSPSKHVSRVLLLVLGLVLNVSSPTHTRPPQINIHITVRHSTSIIFLTAQPKTARKRNTFKSIIKAKLNKHKPSLKF